ncbi:hypothetical protein RR47_GL002293 [Enterococcus columbae DSM 7374 = ATCC 51263]|nr:hypothetical protein RR47_GL002293 [Enterococcus columbae DSM 7374 = ATCC 51263]
MFGFNGKKMKKKPIIELFLLGIIGVLFCLLPFRLQADELSNIAVASPLQTQITSVEQNRWQLTINTASQLKIKQLYVPIWHMDNQSDIHWYQAGKIAENTYQVNFDPKIHQYHEGIYHMHVYAYLEDGSCVTAVLNDQHYTLPEENLETTIQNFQDKLGRADLTVKVNTAREIQQVYLPIWHADDQSDIQWYAAKKENDGNYHASIDLAKHQYHRGNYHIHTYVYFKNSSKPLVQVSPDITFNEYPDEVQASIENYNDKAGSMDIRVLASSVHGIKRVYVPTWSKADQSDIVWYVAQKQTDGSYLAHMNIQNHKENRGNYHLHVYAYNQLNQAKVQVLDDVHFSDNYPNEINAQVQNFDDENGRLNVRVQAFSTQGIDRVYVPIWSRADQSDIVWYVAQKQADGSYMAQMDIAKHQFYRGTYHLHAYAYTKKNIPMMTVLPDVTFQTYPDTIQANIEQVNQNLGSFIVTIHAKTHQGIKQIRVPIWHRSNQSDIHWYEAKKVNNDTYQVQMNVANHNYENGLYQVHVYLTNYANHQTMVALNPVQLSGDYQQRVLSVPYYNQNAWGAPVGCEGVALLQALQAKGYAKQYNPRSFLNEIPHSTDGTPYTGFVGSPFIANNWQFTAIFDQALTKWGQRYGNVSNISGSSTSQLLDQIWQGNPVVAYVTVHMTPLAWGIWQFGRVPNNNHAVTLSGFNKHNGTVFVTDPIDGQYWMPASKFASIYEARKMAVVVR